MSPVTTTMDDTTPPGRRPARIGYLVSGVICLGLAGVWALWAAGLADGISVSWLLPAVLLVSGVAGLLAMVAVSRRTTTSPGRSDGLPGTDRTDEADQADETDETRPYPTEELR